MLPIQNNPGIHFFPMVYSIYDYYLQDELSHFTDGVKNDMNLYIPANKHNPKNNTDNTSHNAI
jgi:hypothetical protein